MPGTKPVVLTFVRYYLPGYKAGGPLRTISNMVEALGDEFDFRIVTSDRDATDTEPYPHLAGEQEWFGVGKAKVLYLAPSRKGVGNIGRIIRETPHDVLYLNSFFDPIFTLKPLLARRLGLAPKARCILAPRGEFSPGALEIKARKKKSFLAAARMAGLYRDLTWHASGEHEAADIRRAFGSVAQRIETAMNLPDMTPRTPPPFVPRAPGEPLRLVFLSRISPKKNLDYALEVLGKVRAPVTFDIYGLVDDDTYWNKCKEIIKTLPSNVVAIYRGSIPHLDVAITLAAYDLFFLPTRGENYGHAIFEALSVGTPVLISDTTPWRNLAEKQVGWDLPLGVMEKFVEHIENMAAITEEENAIRRRCAKTFSDKALQNNIAKKDNYILFSEISKREEL